MEIQDIIYICVSAIIIGLQIIATYVGFVTFFYASIQIVFSYPLATISNCLSRDWFAFTSNFFWLFISIPYIHLMAVINIKIVLSFFKNIWKALNLKNTEKRLRQFFQIKNLCDKSFRVDRWGFIYLSFVLINIVFLFIEITKTEDQMVCSVAFAAFTCYPPIVCVFYVLIKCIKFNKSHEKIGTIYQNDVNNQINNSDNSEKSHQDNQNQIIIDHETETNNDDENEELSSIQYEEEEEDKNDENQVKKWQVYFDPSQIIIQKEIIDFIQDSDVNNYQYINYNNKIIPSFFITAIFLEYIIYFIYYFADIGQKRDFFDIIIFIVRILYSFLSYRFLIQFNAINYIMNFSKIKEKHKFIWWTYLVAIGISILILIVVGIGMIIIYGMFKPFKLNEYQYLPIYENVTFSQQSSICQMKFYDFDLLEYAGFSSLGQTKNEKVATEILKMVLNNQTLPINSIDNPISNIYTIQINEKFYIRVFESLISHTSFSFMLDLYINDFAITKISHGIIPFFSVAIEVFLYRFLYFLSSVLSRYLLLNLVRNFAYFANTLYDSYDIKNYGNSTIIYVGHSIGGLIAKGIGAKRNVPSIAFETLNYYHSLFHMAINLDSTFNFVSEKLKIINVFSPSQIFSGSEESSTVNVILPKWKGMNKFIGAYDTFCLIAAGCTLDTRYDQFCNAVIGKNNFLDLFKLWNRSRSDISI